MPFAIVGSEEEIEVNGEPVRARRYPWGIVEVDNPQHSDFQRLRNALLSTHLTDLKEITVRGRRAVRCACGETDPACASPSSIPHHLWLDSCNASDFSTVRTQVAQAKNDALTSCFPHPHHPSTLRAFDARRLPLRAIPNGKALQERGGWTAGWTGVRRQPGRERPSRRPSHAECAPQGGPDPSRGCVSP